MRIVAHSVCLERRENRRAHIVRRRNLGERERFRRILQTLEMTVQLGNASVINAQALPNGVAALNDAVEYRNACLLARHKLAVDAHQDIGISRIG